MEMLYDESMLSPARQASYRQPLNEGFALDRRASGAALELVGVDLGKIAARFEGISYKQPLPSKENKGATRLSLIRRAETLRNYNRGLLSGIRVGDAVEALREDIPYLLGSRTVRFETMNAHTDESTGCTYITINPGEEHGAILCDEREEAWTTLNSLVEEDLETFGKKYLSWKKAVPKLNIASVEESTPDIARRLVKSVIAVRLPFEVELAPALRPLETTD
jgi:hypothetical protein